MAFVSVLPAGELAPGELRAVTVAGVDVVVYRVGEEYFATQRKCLHQGGDLADGLLSGRTVTCAVHGWRFDVASGRHAVSPETCLRTYPVRVVGDRIEIDAAAPRWQGEPHD